MEPMDTEEGTIGISVAENPERNPATVAELPMVADPAVGPGADEGAGDSTRAVDGLTSCDVGRGDLHGSAEPVPDENRGADAEHESDLGVTPAAPAGPAGGCIQSYLASRIFFAVLRQSRCVAPASPARHASTPGSGTRARAHARMTTSLPPRPERCACRWLAGYWRSSKSTAGGGGCFLDTTSTDLNFCGELKASLLPTITHTHPTHPSRRRRRQRGSHPRLALRLARLPLGLPACLLVQSCRSRRERLACSLLRHVACVQSRASACGASALCGSCRRCSASARGALYALCCRTHVSGRTSLGGIHIYIIYHISYRIPGIVGARNAAKPKSLPSLGDARSHTRRGSL